MHILGQNKKTAHLKNRRLFYDCKIFFCSECLLINHDFLFLAGIIAAAFIFEVFGFENAVIPRRLIGNFGMFFTIWKALNRVLTAETEVLIARVTGGPAAHGRLQFK